MTDPSAFSTLFVTDPFDERDHGKQGEGSSRFAVVYLPVSASDEKAKVPASFAPLSAVFPIFPTFLL